MRWPWSRSRTTRAKAPLVVRERRAYAAIEEARLWCEQVLREPIADADRRLLTALHREIGMAGLHASHNLRAERRRAMLELAHRRVDARAAARGRAATSEPLGALLDHALGHVRSALGVEGLCDEMAEAQRRLHTARELLAALPEERRRLTTV